MVEIALKNNRCEVRRFRGPLAEDSAQYHSPRFGINFKNSKIKHALYFTLNPLRGAQSGIFFKFAGISTYLQLLENWFS